MNIWVVLLWIILLWSFLYQFLVYSSIPLCYILRNRNRIDKAEIENYFLSSARTWVFINSTRGFCPGFCRKMNNDFPFLCITSLWTIHHCLCVLLQLLQTASLLLFSSFHCRNGSYRVINWDLWSCYTTCYDVQNSFPLFQSKHFPIINRLTSGWWNFSKVGDKKLLSGWKSLLCFS